MQLVLRAQIFVHQYADRDRQRLRADVAGHVQNERLEADDDRQHGNNALERADDRGNAHAEKEQDDQPRQTLFDALRDRFVQIFLCGQTGELCIVLAQLVVDGLDNVLRGDDADDLFVPVQNRQGVLSVILDLFDAVRNLLVVEQIRIGVADERIQRHVFPRNDQILEVDRAAEAVSAVDDIDRCDIVVFTGLPNQLVHGLPNGKALVDADVIGGDETADLVVIIGIDEQDRGLGLVIDHRA